jgi:hypothetical protein
VPRKTTSTSKLQYYHPEYVPHCTLTESYTGTVGKHVVGSKAYWSEAHRELLAMSVEYGVPQFLVTFTANESGWSDMRAACQGEHFSKCPIEATRVYNRRWEDFLKCYLTGGDSELGPIEHVWYRQEDQTRGSLHVHAAIWVTPGMENMENIRGTAPRDCHTSTEKQWRKFVLNVSSCLP